MGLFNEAASLLVGGSSTVGITSSPHGVLGGIWLDGVVSELHTMRNTATRHPLETGGEVVDHVVTEPDTLVIECKITRTPIKVPESHAGGAELVDRDIDVPASETIELPFGLEVSTNISLGFGSVGVPESLLPGRKAVVQFVDGAAGRIPEVFAELQAIMAEKRLVDIRTTLRNYVDMVIEEVSAPVKSGEGGRVLNFTVTAVAIRTATSRIVDAPSPVQVRAVSAVNAGVAAAEAVDDSSVGAEQSSQLHRLKHGTN